MILVVGSNRWTVEGEKRRFHFGHLARAGAPTHEIMAQGRWKNAGMVADYTRAENAGRAAKWLA